MAKCRIGHFVEAQILQQINVDYIDESEVLTPADNTFHIIKHDFTIPFVCGCRNLGEALRRISEGAAMIRTKGEAGTGDVSNAVGHARTLLAEISRVVSMRDDELYNYAKEIGAPYDLVVLTKKMKRLPVFTINIGCKLCCWRSRNTSRCGIDDAIGNGWCFRWIWYFQEW